uniref:Neur_chan_LBD domain-containing protein n=1 Tax=Caenorhabditis tropicalis TaxID=1561998 RepID=A0A1I7UQ95_9PELO
MDYRLQWDPLQYDNITSIRFAGGENQIWRPDILLYNSASEDFDSSFKSNEVVYNTGEVNWIPPGIFRASCKMDITYFPFDDQVCYLKFGSWTYHGLALDLSIIAEEDEDEFSIDLSTYTPSGEWHLTKAPAVKDVKFNSCCKEPYSTVTFYMFLRRRTLFYLFNIILPSLLISIMTLMGFCLPAHDMSEKIGYQTTILLSICFFVTIVSEMTPPTSESVPLLGMFFSSLTLISSVSTAFTITVLNFRYRQVQNIHMHPLFYKVFLIWIPWLLLMKRPGVFYKKRRATVQAREEISFFDNCDDDVSFYFYFISQFVFKCCPKLPEFDYSLSIDSDDTLPLPPRPKPLLKKMHSVPAEHLHLDRKVGDGILKSQRRPLLLTKNTNKSHSLRSRRFTQFEKYIKKCIEDAKLRKNSTYSTYSMMIITYYRHIDEMLKLLNRRLDKQRKYLFKQEDWKFAAMALDRLCLLLITILIVMSLFGMILSTPHFEP